MTQTPTTDELGGSPAGAVRPLPAVLGGQHDLRMKKVLAAGAVLVGVAVAARRFGGPMMQHVDWEKRFERMPDNAPPKWMFRNISAIRENTERILELLERERGSSTAPGQATSD